MRFPNPMMRKGHSCWSMMKPAYEADLTKSSSSIQNSFLLSKKLEECPSVLMILTECKHLLMHAWWRRPLAVLHPMLCCATAKTIFTNSSGTLRRKRNSLSKSERCSTPWRKVVRCETTSALGSVSIAHDDMPAAQVWCDQKQSSTRGYCMQVLVMVTMITKLSLTEMTVLSPPPLALTTSSHSPWANDGMG